MGIDPGTFCMLAWRFRPLGHHAPQFIYVTLASCTYVYIFTDVSCCHYSPDEWARNSPETLWYSINKKLSSIRFEVFYDITQANWFTHVFSQESDQWKKTDLPGDLDQVKYSRILQPDSPRTSWRYFCACSTSSSLLQPCMKVTVSWVLYTDTSIYEALQFIQIYVISLENRHVSEVISVSNTLLKSNLK